MRERRGIQLVPILTPQRQVLLHHLPEAIVVVPLNQMNELVNDQLLEALRRLLDETEVERLPYLCRRELLADE